MMCKVGEVVHVPLKDVDKAKADTGNLTRVIFQVDKTWSQARVAVKSGLLKFWCVLFWASVKSHIKFQRGVSPKITTSINQLNQEQIYQDDNYTLLSLRRTFDNKIDP